MMGRSFLGAAIAVGALASCNAVLGIEEGEPRAETSFCAGKPDGTALPEQTAGDCSEMVCDGNGNVKVVAIESDIPDDGNLCTSDACIGSVPKHTPLTSAPCYAGPASTVGVGICKAGVQQCDPQGNPVGTCAGEVLPKDEACATKGVDDDCDGLADEEGSDCKCGDGIVSQDIGEQCDDGGPSDGDICSPTCKDQAIVQIAAAGSFTCARTRYIVKCWGENQAGALGQGDTEARGDQPNEMGSHLGAIDLGTKLEITAIAIAGKLLDGGSGCHAHALLSDGTIRSWGKTLMSDGPVGDAPGEMGSALAVVNLGKPATAIAAGYSHTCALLSGGEVRCWGQNQQGELGVENKLDIVDPSASLPVDLGTNKTAKAIAAGDNHTCALLTDGSVKCWGKGGVLGLGDGFARGDESGEMGDKLPAVNLGTGTKVTAIAAGANHTCAILSDEAAGVVSLKCWGGNDSAQLGLGDFSNRGDLPDQMGDFLPPVSLGTGNTPKAVAAGTAHTCAILNDGSVKCWGFNFMGLLGLGSTAQEYMGDASGDMGDNLPKINLGTGKATAIAITAGATHTCAQLVDRTVKCWGLNVSGELGLGDMDVRGDSASDMSDSLPTVKLFSDLW